MDNKKRFWKDEWGVFILIGLILGFLAGIYYHQWSDVLKQDSMKKNVNQSSTISKATTSQPGTMNLSKDQMTALGKKNSTKVCIIGLDGATWNVITPLVNSGKMPNLKKLMDNGVYGNNLSLEDTLSPMVWTTIATGKTAQKHGIEGFIMKLPDGYERIPVTSDLRKVKAIWNILSDYGKKVGIISWWVTHPPEQVNGFMISDGFLMHRFSFPDNLSAVVEKNLENENTWINRELKKYTSFTYDPDFKKKYDIGTPEYLHHFVLQEYRKFLLKDYYTITAAKTLFPKIQPDLMAVYYPSIDCASHLSWRYFEPLTLNETYPTTPQEQEWFGSLIPKTYIQMDNYIGDVLKMLPPDTVVIVCSDHGFEARSSEGVARWTNINKLLEEMGLLKYAKGTEIDWANTSVYEIEDLFRPERVLYLNVKGREPKGIVEQKEFDSKRQDIVNQLMGIKTEQGKPLFLKVEMNQNPTTVIDSTKLKYVEDYYVEWKSYSGDIHARINPDLNKNDIVIVGNKKVPMLGIFTSNPQSGDHIRNGMIVLSGGPVKKKQIIHDATVFDITPTALYLMGLPIAADMDGKVLESAINPDYLKDHPILRINTYETGERSQKKVTRNARDEKEFMDALKGLGYIAPQSNTSSLTTSPKK